MNEPLSQSTSGVSSSTAQLKPAAPVDVNVNVGVVSVPGLAGPPVTVGTGGGVASIVHVNDAELVSSVAFVARTVTVCDPSARPAYVTGDAQGTRPVPSSSQSNVAPRIRRAEREVGRRRARRVGRGRLDRDAGRVRSGEWHGGAARFRERSPSRFAGASQDPSQAERDDQPDDEGDVRLRRTSSAAHERSSDVWAEGVRRPRGRHREEDQEHRSAEQKLAGERQRTTDSRSFLPASACLQRPTPRPADSLAPCAPARPQPSPPRPSLGLPARSNASLLRASFGPRGCPALRRGGRACRARRVGR